MSEQNRTVKMYLVHPGTTTDDGDFAFEMQSRSNTARTVQFALQPQDADELYKKLGEYLKEAAATKAK